MSSFFFLQDELLCRQQPMSSDFSLDLWIQIVFPLVFRQAVLQLAHQGLAGLMGLQKMYDRILRKFYWPRIKRDVINYIRSCHICQMSGKTNQKVPLATLQPFAVVTTPFEYLIIDCICPLPQSKCHESSYHSLELHITHGLHLPSCTAHTHSRPPLHQSHSCHHSLISLDCLPTPAPHSHTHI